MTSPTNQNAVNFTSSNSAAIHSVGSMGKHTSTSDWIQKDPTHFVPKGSKPLTRLSTLQEVTPVQQHHHRSQVPQKAQYNNIEMR